MKLTLQSLRLAANEMKIIPWSPGTCAGEESSSISPGLQANMLLWWAQGQWGLLLHAQLCSHPHTAGCSQSPEHSACGMGQNARDLRRDPAPSLGLTPRPQQRAPRATCTGQGPDSLPEPS